MSKEYSRECPDCNGPDLGSLFGGKGDGRCSHCRGKGEVWSLGEGLEVFRLDIEKFEACGTCSGTGQCQTCGGTGYQYYNEDDSDGSSSEVERTTNSESSEGSYSGSYDYSNYEAGETGYKKRSNAGRTSSSDTFGGIIGLLVLIAIGSLIYNKCSDNNTSPRVSQQYTHENVIVQPQAAECETNNTGDYSFINKTSRSIYLFIDRGTWWKTIEVGPNQTITEYNMMATRYKYTYSYYKSSNFNNNDIKGTILVKKCESLELELDLPMFYWYKITADEWTEIKIPAGGNYAIVAPYKNFMIRFSDDSTVHYGNSYAFLSDTIRKIYLQNGYDNNEIEVSIQKYTPWRQE